MLLLLLCCLPLFILIEYLFTVFGKGFVIIKGVTVFTPSFYLERLKRKTDVIALGVGMVSAKFMNVFDIDALKTSTYVIMNMGFEIIYPVEYFRRGYIAVRNKLTKEYSDDETSSDDELTIPDIHLNNDELTVPDIKND